MTDTDVWERLCTPVVQHNTWKDVKIVFRLLYIVEIILKFPRSDASQTSSQCQDQRTNKTSHNDNTLSQKEKSGETACVVHDRDPASHL